MTVCVCQAVWYILAKQQFLPCSRTRVFTYLHILEIGSNQNLMAFPCKRKNLAYGKYIPNYETLKNVHTELRHPICRAISE